jgi:PAS domain-containing protein
MSKSKKTKIHRKIDGQLLQMNKTFSNLKMKQKDKITAWVYEEYKKYVTENDRIPDSEADEHIIDAVLDKIQSEQIWIPEGEIIGYYHRKKPHLQKRLDNEKTIRFKSYVSFYKSVLDQDRAAVVICNLKHEIIYMNPSAIEHYQKWGGEKRIGASIFDCHNEESREKIQRVVDWFSEDESHNIVYTFHNEELQKDVYMVALRNDAGKMIGYYEKHEFRNPETMIMYDLW